MINSAQELKNIADEMPQKLKEEWSSLKNEIIEESERIEKDKNHRSSSTRKHNKKNLTNEELIQRKIDNIRSKVIDINKNFEVKN